MKILFFFCALISFVYCNSLEKRADQGAVLASFGGAAVGTAFGGAAGALVGGVVGFGAIKIEHKAYCRFHKYDEQKCISKYYCDYYTKEGCKYTENAD
jgi:hypothetical protein